MSSQRRAAVVTGASRGIGRAVARDLASRGVGVLVHYHRAREAAERTLASLPGEGHALFQADLSRCETARRLIETALELAGRLDIVVNNAGIYELHPPSDVGWEDWRTAWSRTLAANLEGPAHVCYWAARHMVAHGGGRIVNVSSRGAFRGEPDAPAYGASKAGLNAMSQSLARALAPQRVYVYVVAPGWVDTDMAASHLEAPGGEEIKAQSPLGRVARPREIARTVSFLACDDTEYLTGCIVDAFGASYLRS